MAKSERKPQVKLTPALEDEICLGISTSPYMLEELCKENPHWPRANLIYERRILDPSFGERFARAKQAQIEVLVMHAFNITRQRDIYLSDREGNPSSDHGILNARKMEVDLIKWLAAKLAPKIYGDTNKNANANDGEDFISKNRDKI